MATDYTPTTWAQKLLSLLGVPVSTANTQAVVAWEAAEGGHWHNVDRYNPLNTTQSEPGATSTNAAGVKAYTSWDQGLAATVTTLRNGHYSSILSALQSGSSASDVVNAVVGSPWGTKTISLGAGQTYSGGAAGGSAAGGSVVQASLSDPLGVGSLATSLRKTAITGVIVAGALGLVVIGLLRGTHAVARTEHRAKQVGKVAGTAAAVAA